MKQIFIALKTILKFGARKPWSINRRTEVEFFGCNRNVGDI
jgi:hypothetical protein